MSIRITRRILLASLPATLAAVTNPPAKKARALPTGGEFFRFLDPTTETPVVRLTNPAYTSLLPSPTNRFVSLKDRFLIFSSDRTGKASPFQADLRTGTLTQLAQTAELDPRSLVFDQKQKTVYLLDGGALKEIALPSKRVHVVADGITAFSRYGANFAVVRQGRLENLASPQSPLAENVSAWSLVRPGGAGCAFGRENGPDEREFWYVPLTGSENPNPVMLAKGRVSNPFWSPDGQSLLFLREMPAAETFLPEIHEVFPETRAERCVDKTSQFAAFAPNGDASVFVGASRSKAQPTLILLLRTTQRELTLCEHRASHPAAVSPVFSPDSRRVYFQSDHEGKSALYSVNVELLVEPTTAES